MRTRKPRDTSSGEALEKGTRRSMPDQLNLTGKPGNLDPMMLSLTGRLDLRFLYSTGVSKPWPCFVIEAKRLHVTFPKSGWKSLVSEYATTETQRNVEEEQGMMCFVIGRYSHGLQAGAMLGYVYDGKVETARNAVGEAVVKHAEKLKLSRPYQFRVSPVIPQESRISESLHLLPAGPLYYLPHPGSGFDVAGHLRN